MYYSYKLSSNALNCCDVLLHISVADSDNTLELTTNQTTVCLGDNYYLFCISQESFGEMCQSNTAEWLRGSHRIHFFGSTYMWKAISATVHILWLSITEDEFSEPQTFQCYTHTCWSNVVSVRKYGEFNKPGTHAWSYMYTLWTDNAWGTIVCDHIQNVWHRAACTRAIYNIWVIYMHVYSVKLLPLCILHMYRWASTSHYWKCYCGDNMD